MTCASTSASEGTQGDSEATRRLASRRLIYIVMQLHKAFSSCLIAICVGLTLTATTLKRVDVSEKGFVVIRDGVLNLETLESLSQLLLNHASWRYVGEGEYGFHKNGQPLREQGRYFKSGWPWLANLNTARLRGTTLGRDLVDIVAELSGRSNYTLEAATGILLRRGDEPRMTGGLDQSEDNAGTPHNHDIAVNVFIELTAKRWLKNDYGETLFYYPVSAETGSGMREVLTAVHLKHGRIVVWTDDVPFTLRPPSMNYEQARCGVLLRFGSDNKLASEEGKVSAVICLVLQIKFPVPACNINFMLVFNTAVNKCSLYLNHDMTCYVKQFKV